jgi:hypothetical protein
MSELEGMFVSLTTGSTWSWSGTNDHVYLGVAGTVGGREFALGVDGFDDFEEGTVVTYSIGEAAELFGGKEPATAADVLESMLICQPNVTHVYLRKQGDRTHSGDDLWELDSAFVYLLSDDSTRVFQSTGSALLGNEYGLKVYLAETAHYGSYLDARIPVEGVAECERDR